MLAPDGSLVGYNRDETTTDLQRLSDPHLIAVRLPLDGTYRIEARSELDDQAGAYTLLIERVPTVWYPKLFQDYVGHYLDGPWQWDAAIYIENDKLWFSYYGDPWRTELHSF